MSPQETRVTLMERLASIRARRRQAAAESLRERLAAEDRERAFTAAEELAQLGSWMWQVGSDVVTWSAQVHRIFGTDPNGPAPRYDVYKSMVHPDDDERMSAAIRQAIATGGTYEVEHRIIRPTGEIREVRGRGRVDLDANGQPLRLSGSLEDLTDKKRAAEELNRTRDLFSGVLDAATEQSIIATDPQGLITVFNTGAERMLGYSADEMIGTSPERLHDAAEIAARATELGLPADFGVFLAQAATGRPETRQWTYITKDGRRLLASITVSAMRGPDGEVNGYIKVGTDITELKRAEDKLRYQAMHDGLTGLPNRMLLMERVERALSSEKPVALLYMDLDGFKAVNDSLGHAAGDRALVQVADQLRAVARPTDTLARLGGDEFVMLCEGIATTDEAIAVAGGVLTALRTPFTVDDQTFALSGSIGVTLAAQEVMPEELLHLADQAMYAAKASGKGRVHVGIADTEADLQRTANATRQLSLFAELGYAVERDELVMYGQPIVDMESGRVVAVESLVRWNHPDGTTRLPSHFLEMVESTDLVHPVGSRILRESCRLASTWVAALGPDAPAVHVNISGRQLEDGILAREVESALAEFDLDPSQVVLELTETHMLIASSMRRELQGLRDRGVRVAIDDLGTGYSSLTRITELPVDILKIDMSFVAGVDSDPACAAVVRGILAIGDALGLDVVAEGVETQAQAAVLGEHGCTSAQGFLYSPALPEGELLTRLAS